MKGAVLLSIFALFCGLHTSQATSCESLTLNTCEKSLFATGKCSTQVCACVSGYVAGPFGCQMRQKAVVSAEFNGQIETGEDASLECTEGIGTATYEWSKDSTVDSTETSESFDFTTAASSNDGEYTCKSSIAGVLSEESDPFTVTVLDTVTEKPVVTGMPTKIGDGFEVTLTCSKPPVTSATTYTWNKDSTEVSGETDQTSTFTFASADVSKDVYCSIGGIDSDTVSFPATAETEIDGVTITARDSTVMEDESLILTCELTGGFSATGVGSAVSFAWKKDGTSLPTQTTHQLSLANIDSDDAGVYVCTATFDAPIDSTDFTLTVKSTMLKDEVATSSDEFLKKGHSSLSCNYKSANTLLPVTYAWYKDSKPLSGVTDKILQFSDVTSDLDGAYACTVTSEDGTVMNDPVTVSFDDSASIVAETPTVNSDGIEGVGNTITFSCDNVDYVTPGLSYKWYLDTDEEAGEISKTFKYTPKDTDSVDVKCLYSFDGQNSQEGSTTISPEYHISTAIGINGLPVTTLKPVTGTKVKLMCNTVKSASAGEVTYQWQEASTDVPGETSMYYEKTAGTAGTPVTIRCKATVNGEEKTSSSVTMTPQTTVEKPVIDDDTGNANDNQPIRGSAFYLRCNSQSYADGAVFEWTKDSNTISGETSYVFMIDEVAESDDGDYSCKMTVGGETSVAADAITVTSQVNEVTCTYAEDCSGENFDTTACYEGKCKCKSGYTLEGGLCSSSVAMVGSILMVMTVAFTQIFL